MNRYGIDVSSYNGRIDWERVAQAGCAYGIIKITRRNLAPDSRFLENWRGCTAHGIPCGVYRYSYEATAQQAKPAAEAVVKLLEQVQAPAGTLVWWDLEDASIEPHLPQERQALKESILTAREVVERHGYGFGIYTGLWWYRAVLRDMGLDVPWWIARYPSLRAVAFGTPPEQRFKPEVNGTLWGWQYSDAGQVPGINHSTDLNLIYGGTGDSAEPTVLLRRGSRGEGVCWVQEQLNRHGADLTVDGIFGTLTEAAVRAFQRSHGLEVDGIVGPATRAELRK